MTGFDNVGVFIWDKVWQSFFHINTPTSLKPSHSSHLPAYKDETECSETSAYKIQTPGNYREENIQQNKAIYIL
jgi:hypothetical protein